MLSLDGPPGLSLEFACGTETSEAWMLVTDAAVTAGAGLFLPWELPELFNGLVFIALVGEGTDMLLSLSIDKMDAQIAS